MFLGQKQAKPLSKANRLSKPLASIQGLKSDTSAGLSLT